jgi:hypothetical protein
MAAEALKMQGHTLVIASDLERGGMGCELIDNDQAFVAEVFRCDADKTLTLTGDIRGLPLGVVDWFIAEAKRGLDPFEDGTPISDALPKGE